MIQLARKTLNHLLPDETFKLRHAMHDCIGITWARESEATDAERQTVLTALRQYVGLWPANQPGCDVYPVYHWLMPDGSASLAYRFGVDWAGPDDDIGDELYQIKNPPPDKTARLVQFDVAGFNLTVFVDPLPRIRALPAIAAIADPNHRERVASTYHAAESMIDMARLQPDFQQLPGPHAAIVLYGISRRRVAQRSTPEQRAKLVHVERGDRRRRVLVGCAETIREIAALLLLDCPQRDVLPVIPL